MSLKRSHSQSKISDFFNKRVKTDVDGELKTNSNLTVCTDEKEDSTQEDKELIPSSSRLDTSVNDGCVCTVSCEISKDKEKQSIDINIPEEKHKVIPSSPTLESSDFNDNSGNGMCDSPFSQKNEIIPSSPTLESSDFNDNSGNEMCDSSFSQKNEIILSSPTLELSDLNENSGAVSCASPSDEEIVSHTMSSASVGGFKVLTRGLAKNCLCRLKPNHLDFDSFQNHLHITDSQSSSVKYDASRDVRMPFYVSGMQGPHSRWDIIRSSLDKCNTLSTGKELEKIIRNYNQNLASKLDFSGLDKYLNLLTIKERCSSLTTLTKIAVLAIEAENLCQKPIPILRQQKDQAITLSQHLIASLLANAFFCTFISKNEPSSSLPSISFLRLFASDSGNRFGKYRDRSDVMVNKLRCIFHYFSRVTAAMPEGNVTFHRQVLKESDAPNWSESETRLTELCISSTGNIEDEEGLLQVDFANKWVGGGALGSGCVQEEIRFMITPELIISRLFTEVLGSNECIIVTGCETFSTYKGYADTFEWTGNFVDQTSSDETGHKLSQVVMIDALHLEKKHMQFAEHLVRRELNKAYCGFFCPMKKQDVQLPAVSTGNWGCGAFGGDVYLKFLIQLMAAAEAGRDICYFTFGDSVIENNLYKMHFLLKQESVTVGQLYKMIKGYEPLGTQKKQNGGSELTPSLFDYILTQLA